MNVRLLPLTALSATFRVQLSIVMLLLGILAVIQLDHTIEPLSHEADGLHARTPGILIFSMPSDEVAKIGMGCSAILIMTSNVGVIVS